MLEETMDLIHLLLFIQKAMEDLGFGTEEINDILKIISAILKLGNLNFVPTTNMDGTEGCSIANDYELYDVCEILKAELISLQTGLTSRSIETGDGTDYLVTDLSTNEASNARDKLCRTLYSRLFTWLLSRINETVKMKTPRKCRTLGLLDLYGFEPMYLSEPCGFEQLVFNFAAEKVQSIINEWTIMTEQQEYLLEGVEWTSFDCLADNSQVVALLERGSSGVFAILDEVCLAASPSISLPVHPNNGNSDSPETSSSMQITTQDDFFMEKLAERFASHQSIQVYQAESDQDSKLPQHCFRYQNSKRISTEYFNCFQLQDKTFRWPGNL